MSVKAKVEAIIYATEEPVTISQLASLLREPVLAELRAEEDARLRATETRSHYSGYCRGQPGANGKGTFIWIRRLPW